MLKRVNFTNGVVVAIFLMMIGCASSVQNLEDETLLPEIDVVQVKEDSEEALKLAQEAKIDVQMVNTKIAEVDNNLVLLGEKVSAVSSAKIEELENRLSLLTEAFKELYEKVAAIEVLPQIKVKKPTRIKPAVFSPTEAGTILTSSEYDLYQNALRLFDRRSYVESKKLFADLIKKYPKSNYADKSQYWIGEISYAKSDYAQAIKAFNLVHKYKNSSKADDAQLKLALSYLRLGKNDLAIDEFKRLINRYPASEFVPSAQKYLSEIKL
jgi:tol-pal system protein YbgF